MKPRPVFAFVFFLSSYAPLGAIIICKDFELQTRSLKHPTAVAIVLSLAVLSVIVLRLAMRSIRRGLPVRVVALTGKSGELVNYTIPYMISFFAFDLGNWNEIFAFVIFLILMYVLTVHTQNIFINPVLALMGWFLYDVTFLDGAIERQGAFLTRVELHAGDVAVVQRVAQFFYIVTTPAEEVRNEAQPALRSLERS